MTVRSEVRSLSWFWFPLGGRLAQHARLHLHERRLTTNNYKSEDLSSVAVSGISKSYQELADIQSEFGWISYVLARRRIHRPCQIPLIA
jgi:hypothetical protein